MFPNVAQCIDDLCILPEPIDLDIHSIPSRPGEPKHLHLDTRYLVELPQDAQPRASEESFEVAWFTPEEARKLLLDESVTRLFELAFA